MAQGLVWEVFKRYGLPGCHSWASYRYLLFAIEVFNALQCQ